MHSLGYTQEIGTKKIGGVDLCRPRSDLSLLYILLDLLFRILVGGLTALQEHIREVLVHNYTVKPLCKTELLQHCKEKSIAIKQKLSGVLCQGQCSREVVLFTDLVGSITSNISLACRKELQIRFVQS